MLRVKSVPSLGLMLAGSMDCLTTLVGLSFFGAVECNPFIAGLANTNLVAFTLVKLAATVAAGFAFHAADKMLSKTRENRSNASMRIRYLLRGTYFAATGFLFLAVINNVVAIAFAL
jgi:hypothetical protein